VIGTIAQVLVAAIVMGPGNGDIPDYIAEAPARAESINVAASWAEAVARQSREVARTKPGRTPEFRRAPACREVSGTWTKGGDDGTCPVGADEALVLDCEGADVRQPMWRRVPVGETDWGPWIQLDEGGCGEALPVLTLEEFRRLPLAPPVLRLQPDRGWVLVNKETIVMTERVEQAFVTNLLGRDVEVVASPERFHYMFGDGTDLWTRSAGNPYPNHDTYRVYEQPGTFQITLTTEWSGRYRVAGDGTWHAVTGTAQTSTTSAPFEVVERRSRLVDDLCTDIPKPADC